MRRCLPTPPLHHCPCPQHQAAAIGVPKTYIAQLRANLQLLRLRLFLLLDFTVPSVEAGLAFFCASGTLVEIHFYELVLHTAFAKESES